MSFPRLVSPSFLPLVIGLGLLSGGCAAPVAVAGASYGADGTLLVASNKTVTDHLMSMVSKQDCALWRVIRGRRICKEREGDKDPYDVDYDHAERMVGEDGVHYVAPLRAAPDAPAASWDAAAYTPQPPPSAPEPAPAPKVPVIAVADAAPEPTPAAPAVAPPKAKKHKAVKPARSVKKPSRGPAAPAS
jgi:hypothetical protein